MYMHILYPVGICYEGMLVMDGIYTVFVNMYVYTDIFILRIHIFASMWCWASTRHWKETPGEHIHSLQAVLGYSFSTKTSGWKNGVFTPWKSNGWNLHITHLERKMIFQTFMIMVHVNLPGCTNKNSSLTFAIGHWFLGIFPGDQGGEDGRFLQTLRRTTEANQREVSWWCYRGGMWYPFCCMGWLW